MPSGLPSELLDRRPDVIVFHTGQRASPLRIGQELIIPPTTGVLHTVGSGDTVQAIANKYKADASAITNLDFNGLTPPFALTTGQKIMVPGGEKPWAVRAATGASGPVEGAGPRSGAGLGCRAGPTRPATHTRTIGPAGGRVSGGHLPPGHDPRFRNYPPVPEEQEDGPSTKSQRTAAYG